MARETHVYIIAEDGTGYIKIGVAGNPGARECELQTGNPRRISLHVTYPFPTKWQAAEAERAMHDKFAEYRAVGEWFLLDIDVAHHSLGEIWRKILGHEQFERAVARLVVNNG